MHQPVYVKIHGVIPQLMNNGRRKNPLDPWVKELAKYSKKRTKTDDDHIAMMEAEFKGALYLLKDDDSKHPFDGSVPYWPADNIHACIKTAAKDKKLGKIFDSAVVVMPPGGKLTYKGPKTRNSLWENPNFRFVKPTRRGIMSCRPIFRDWEVEFSLRVLEEKLNVEDLKQLIVDAGKYVGLSDWPRRWGLFSVKEFSQKEVQIDVK